MSDHKGDIVLVIEHEALFGENLFNTLKDAGYDCYLVKNEQESIQRMKQYNPHLVIIDVSDTQIDAYKILEAKKIDQTIASIPTIALSMVPGTYDAKRIASLGVSGEIVDVKINPIDVLDKVNHLIDEKDKGSEFSPHAILRNKRILWVEDDKFLGTILQKRFTAYQCVVDLARSGDDAFVFLSRHVPDIIVLDLVLPGMSGFEILKKIKDTEAYASVPVIIFSNLNQNADLERAKILGAQRFFVKASVSLDQITKEVEELLR